LRDYRPLPAATASQQLTEARMTQQELPAFDAPDIAVRLPVLADEALDALPYGVVELDHQGKVLRYNAVESQYSGLPRERVIGRHFFHHVAPCTDNRIVAKRYSVAALDETIQYTFSLRMKPVPVMLRMLKAPGSERMYLLVRWI
jgi:photoactive yellow protein